MEPVGREMTLRDYARVVVRRKWVVVIAVALAVIGAAGLSLSQTAIYQADAQVIVQPRQSGGLFQNPQGNITTNERSIQTEIQVVEGETVRLRVQDKLGLDERPASADASSVGQTDVIAIRVRSSDPQTAATLANAYAAAYIDVRREQAVEELLTASAEVQNKITELQTQIDTLPEGDPQRTVLLAQQATFRQTLDQLQVDAALRTGGASVIQSAEVPESPVEPTPLRTTVLAGVVGLLLGLGAAFLIDYTDTTVKNEDDLEQLTDLPVLAVVPVDPPPDNRPIAISQPNDYAVETYRGLRTNVQFLGLDKRLKIIQVTSSVAGEGKTTTSANLAVVLAQAGHRVVMVDADLRRPRLHQVFSTSASPGLTDLLLGDDLALVIQPIEIDDATRFDIVTSGAVPPNPSELLSSPRMTKLLEELADDYDHVIVDSAPILPVADSIALSGAVDALLLVAQAGRASRSNVAESLERLERVDAPVIGLVLNQASGAERRSYQYGGYGPSVAARGAGVSAAPSAPESAAPAAAAAAPLEAPAPPEPPAPPAWTSADPSWSSPIGSSVPRPDDPTVPLPAPSPGRAPADASRAER